MLSTFVPMTLLPKDSLASHLDVDRNSLPQDSMRRELQVVLLFCWTDTPDQMYGRE